MSRLLEGMRAAFHEDLLVWQIRSLNFLLEDAAEREPELVERGHFDAQFALAARLINELAKRNAEGDNEEGTGGLGGRPFNFAEWELRTYALASVEALTKALGGHGHKTEARSKVAEMMTASGVPTRPRNYFDYAARAKWPERLPVDLVASRENFTKRMLEQHSRGEQIEAYIRAGIHARCRVVRLLERGGVLINSAGRVVP